jgi:hypothetical protein
MVGKLFAIRLQVDTIERVAVFATIGRLPHR